MPEYKNSFRAPAYYEEVIIDEEGSVVGTIRIKPSSVLWKPKNAQKYFSVKLEKLTEWITDPDTKARKTDMYRQIFGYYSCHITPWLSCAPSVGLKSVVRRQGALAGLLTEAKSCRARLFVTSQNISESWSFRLTP